MKRSFSIYLMALCASQIAFAQHHAATPATPAASVESVEKSILLPAIRRIAIDIPQTNSNDFRSYLNGKNLGGILALPLSEEEVEQDIMHRVEDSVREAGRFWALSVDSTIDFIAQDKKQGAQAITDRLRKKYDLDGWLQSELQFRPDHTLLRLTLRDAAKNRSLAREDITLSAQPSGAEISSALQSALTRLISTLGHDGQITFVQDDIVTVDFGKERGVVTGTKLKAGVLVLSAFHPQTGEFLRAKRIDTHELEVMETRKGSAMCRITAIDKVSLGEISQRYGKGGHVQLLAWRDVEKKAELPWKDPVAVETEPLVGGTGSGFGTTKPRPEARTKTEVSPRPEETYTTLSTPRVAQVPAASEPAAAAEVEQNSAVVEKIPTSESAQDSGSHFSYYPKRLRVGLGGVNGTLSELSPAPRAALVSRDTGFSPAFFVDAIFHYDEWEIEAGVEYKYYNSSDKSVVSGREYNLALGGSTDVYNLGFANVRAGAAIDYMAGTVYTALLKREVGNINSSRKLDEVGLTVFGEYVQKIPNAATVNAVLGFNLPEGGALLKLTGSRVDALPKEFSAFLILRTAPHNDWTEYGLGVQWDVLPR